MPRRVRPPEITEEQRREISLSQTRSRPREYQKEYNEKPTLLSRDDARLLYAKNYFANPSYISVIAGIDGRLSAIVGSREFRAVLAGMTPEELEAIEKLRLDKVARNEEAEKDPRVARADEMIGKLQWALTALGGTHNGFQEDRVESFRQTAQLGVLLKQQFSDNMRVYDALKIAAGQIKKDDPTPYVPKSKRKKDQDEVKSPQADAQEEINPPQADSRNEINPPQADSQDEIKLSPSEDKRQSVPYNLQGDMIDDLYYLDEALNLGLDMPALDPGTVVPKPDLRNVNNWEDYLKAQTSNIPHDREGQQERLANVLLGTFELKRREAAALQGKVVPPSPFQMKVAENNAAKIRKAPVFKQLCKDPGNVRALLRAGSTGDVKRFNATINIFRPFATPDKAQSMLVLKKLKGMVEYMDPKRGRSSAWKALIDSIDSINLEDPTLDPEKKLKEIYDKDCAYMKGKKSLRNDDAKQNRFDQAMDVLSVLGETGEYARLAAQSVVDRVNEVRTGHDLDYEPINLKQFGAGQVIEHSNAPKKPYNALDVLPAAKALPVFPKEEKSNFKPLHEYTAYIAPLQSENEVSLPDLRLAIATTIALSKRQAYFLPNRKHLKDQDLSERFKIQGSAVIQDGILNNKNKKVDLDTELFALDADPAVKALARKYMNPEARRALLKELPPEEEKAVKWADQQRIRPAEKAQNIINEADRKQEGAAEKQEGAAEKKKQVKHPERKTVYNYKPEEAPNQKDPKNPDGQQREHGWRGAYGKDDFDPRRLNVNKLLEDYKQVQRELAADAGIHL